MESGINADQNFYSRRPLPQSPDQNRQHSQIAAIATEAALPHDPESAGCDRECEWISRERRIEWRSRSRPGRFLSTVSRRAVFVKRLHRHRNKRHGCNCVRVKADIVNVEIEWKRQHPETSSVTYNTHHIKAIVPFSLITSGRPSKSQQCQVLPCTEWLQ